MLRALVPSGSGGTGHTHSSPGLLTGRSRPDLLTISPTPHQTPVCVCVCVCACTHSVMSNSAAPWTVAHQAPLSVGFPRQGYWSELPFPPPGDLTDTGSEPVSLGSPALAGRFFTTDSGQIPHLLGCWGVWVQRPVATLWLSQQLCFPLRVWQSWGCTRHAQPLQQPLEVRYHPVAKASRSPRFHGGTEIREGCCLGNPVGSSDSAGL